MATGLQIRNVTNIISGGYNGERKGFNGGYYEWTDMPLSGSVEAEYYYANSYNSDNANSSCVFLKIRDSWTTTKDPATNTLTVTVTSTLVSVRNGDFIGNPGNTAFLLRAYDRQGGSVVWSGTSNFSYQGVILGNPVELSRHVITLKPQQTVEDGTIYYRGNVAGHDNDPVPNIYTDEFYFGTQFRNVLPDRPPKPTVSVISQTPVDCQTIDATLKISQGNFGAYGVETAYYRYKTTGEWSNYYKVTTSQIGTFTIVDLPPNTLVTVEAYSTGDGTTSDHQIFTFTTPPRPKPATIAFASQVAEADEVSLKATINYTQPLESFGTLTTYARYKVGDGVFSDWFVVANKSASGSFDLRHLTPNRQVFVETYSVGDGLCSATQNRCDFYTFRPIDPPVLNEFSQSDTGSCINVTLPWTQDDNTRFQSGKTLFSFQVGNGEWSGWSTADNWKAGSFNNACVPYGTEICVRAYSVGDGIRGEMSEKCIVVSEKPVDDTPYTGGPFTIEPLCHSLLYLAELICQEEYAIRYEERVIYTNEEQKLACDGDPDDPTLHSMLSRIYRYFGAVLCLICQGLNDDLNFFKRGPALTVLQTLGNGEFSEWVKPDSKVTKDSKNLVFSGAIYDAIDEFIHTAFYYIGDWDYLTYNETTLNKVLNPKKGDTALVKNGADGTNQTYTYDGSKWTKDKVNEFNQFEMVHVNKESSFAYDDLNVTVPAGSGWFWYNDNWNQMDATIDKISVETKELLTKNMVSKQSPSDEDMRFAILNRASDGLVNTPSVPATKTIYFVTEPV